jgi:hypothetical protein
MSAMMTTMTMTTTQQQQQQQKQKPIFRFKFSDVIVDMLDSFAQIHKYETRQDFKESWETWLEDNQEIVQLEKNRLERLGFQGDVEDKMYKSTRYYFCKKTNEKKEPQKRRKYVSISKEVIQAMDSHIEMCLRSIVNRNDSIQQEETVQNYKPSIGFIHFCESNYYLVENEKDHIHKEYDMKQDDIELKLKKTYKNRYFIQTN